MSQLKIKNLSTLYKNLSFVCFFTSVTFTFIKICSLFFISFQIWVSSSFQNGLWSFNRFLVPLLADLYCKYSFISFSRIVQNLEYAASIYSWYCIDLISFSINSMTTCFHFSLFIFQHLQLNKLSLNIKKNKYMIFHVSKKH